MKNNQHQLEDTYQELNKYKKQNEHLIETIFNLEMELTAKKNKFNQLKNVLRKKNKTNKKKDWVWNINKNKFV